MKNLIILFSLIFISFMISCKNDNSTEKSNNEGNEVSSRYPRFMVASRPGAYQPKGLRKLSVIEMKEMGQKGQIDFNFVCKDEKGNVVDKDYYSKGPEPKFMQMYVNENDVVVEAVVMEMSDEIRSIMAMMRFISM